MSFKRKLLLFVTFCCFLLNFGQKKDFLKVSDEKSTKNKPFLTNSAFISGEELRYKISYGKKNKKSGAILAAYATLNVADSTLHNGTKIYVLNGHGKTTKIFSLFIKVSHKYKSLLDHKNLETIESSMYIKEGKYYNQDSTIVSENNLLKNSDSNDMLGAFYKLRAISREEVSLKDTLFFNYFYNNTIYNSNVIKLGEEIVKTKFGKLNTIKFAPLLEKGRIFKENSQAIVWVADNMLHVPVKIEIPILVGSIYVNLISYKGLAFNLNE